MTKPTRQVADYRELLRAGRWFRGLPEPFQDALLGMGHLRRAATHEIVMLAGTPCSEVVEGKVRVGRRDERGDKELLLTIIEPPNWCGAIGLFDGLPRSHDMTAEEDSVLVHVSAASLVAFLDREPRYSRDLGRLVTGKLRLAFMGMEEAARSSVTERVAHRLAMMAEGYGEWADRSYALVKVSQETLATMVASFRQSVNRALRSLESAGLIKPGYAGVELLDIEALRHVRQTDERVAATLS